MYAFFSVQRRAADWTRAIWSWRMPMQRTVTDTASACSETRITRWTCLTASRRSSISCTRMLWYLPPLSSPVSILSLIVSRLECPLLIVRRVIGDSYRAIHFCRALRSYEGAAGIAVPRHPPDHGRIASRGLRTEIGESVSISTSRTATRKLLETLAPFAMCQRTVAE